MFKQSKYVDPKVTFDSNKFRSALSAYEAEIDLDLQDYFLRVNNDIETINTDVNIMVDWGLDIFIYQQKDFWATPAQTLAKLSGDCEDIVFLKWFLFLLAGVPVNSMRFVYCTVNGAGHMVLARYPYGLGKQPFIYDNLTNKVLPAKKTNLKVVMMFDMRNIYTNNKAHSLDTTSFSMWEGLKHRLELEGLTITQE